MGRKAGESVENVDRCPALVNEATGDVKKQDIVFTRENWTQYLGVDKYYATYVAFFDEEIHKHGVGQTLERFLLAEDSDTMLIRFTSGAFHPIIQTGYGAEFGSDAMIAQGLAQTAVHQGYDEDALPIFRSTSADTPRRLSLFEILRKVYDSPILKPVMPYDPNAFLSARRRDACKDGRPEEIARIAGLWWSSSPVSDAEMEIEINAKVEELFWVATLLLVGTGKAGRKPRLDFFLMHVLNCTLFLPSLARIIPTVHSKKRLLTSLLPVILLYLEMRGRPRIDIDLVMSYTDTPRPPSAKVESKGSSADALEPGAWYSWPEIIAEVLHAPDAHTIKVIRSLYYAAQHYGSTPPGAVVGAVTPGGEETHHGIRKLDGTLFIRAAGVVMSTMGWLRYGEKAGQWDRSALGWEDAWKDGNDSDSTSRRDFGA